MTEQHNKDNTMLTELLKLSISESAKGGQPSQVAQHVSVPTTSPAIQVPQQSQLAQPKQGFSTNQTTTHMNMM
jgi:hypothetical protein